MSSSSVIRTDSGKQVLAHGRSSRSNKSGRYELVQIEKFDDGWAGHCYDEVSRVDKTVMVDAAKSILSYNESPDLRFDRTINPYRGCEHGCIYCFARPTHAYLGLSPGLDFETKLFYKPEAASLLRRELAKRDYAPARVQLGANTDCYQPIERHLLITRRILEVLAEFQHPLAITTKNHLVTRDIDILSPMAERRLAFVMISITTLDHKLARAMEPRASSPQRRLAAIRKLASSGIPVIVNVSPVIPGLTDHEMEEIMGESANAGARYAHYSILRLSHELADLFKEWLAGERPDRTKRVMSLIRQTRGGKENDTRFGLRMVGEGPVANMLRDRFRLAKKRFGLDQKVEPLRVDLFTVPPQPGVQHHLF